MAKPLSPAAKAVLDAAQDHRCHATCGEFAAAIIRAAADQAAPAVDPRPAPGSGYSAGCVNQQISIRLKLLAIVDELEAQS